MARVRRRRALPDARAAGGARRPRPAGLRALRGLRRAALRRRRSTRRSCARRRCTCARGRSCSRSRRWRPDADGRDAQARPTTCAPRRAARWRGSATAAGTRSCRPGRRAGRFDDELVDAAAEARARRGGAPVALGRRGAVAPLAATLVPDFARAARRARSGCRSRRVLERVGDAPAAARDGQLRPAGRQRARRVRGRRRRRRPAPCLLVDDVRFSGWTLAMVAGQLRRRGAGRGLPARAGHGVLSGRSIGVSASRPR